MPNSTPTLGNNIPLNDGALTGADGYLHEEPIAPSSLPRPSQEAECGDDGYPLAFNIVD